MSPPGIAGLFSSWCLILSDRKGTRQRAAAVSETSLDRGTNRDGRCPLSSRTGEDSRDRILGSPRKTLFAGLDSPYVSLPAHDEAVARLVYAIEISQPRVMLIAPAGLGKSVVLRQAFRSRSPRRRLILVNCPGDRRRLTALLAERPGKSAGPRAEPARSVAGAGSRFPGVLARGSSGDRRDRTRGWNDRCGERPRP